MASQQPRQAQAGATAAAGAAAAGGAVAVAPVGAAGAGSAVAGVAAAGIAGAFIQFLAALAEQHRLALSRELGRYTTRGSEIAGVVRQEMALEREFARRAADRLAGSLPQVLRIADPVERERKLRGLLEREERFAAQRAEAMFARAIAALTRSDLRGSSPMGAFWRLGSAHKHTEGCKFMAGWPGRQGRFWPWAVLDRVHPPRHYGCTAGLHGYAEAILEGWMTPSDVPDPRAAVRAAAGVVMEQDEADAVLAELDVRDQLQERGVDTSAIAFAGVVEAFDEGQHPDAKRSEGGKGGATASV